MLSVLLLGQPQLVLDGNPLAVTRRKSRALIYYLAAHQRPLTRAHLLPLFWPDLDRPAAQQALRTTLHTLRQFLRDYLVADEDALALSPDTDVDVRQFETILNPLTDPRAPQPDNHALSDVLARYRGDFLDTFSLPDSEDFDDWAAAQRERYRRLAIRGLTALARQHEIHGRFSDALDALDRALAFDTLQEDLQRATLRLHYLAGDRPGAIRRYEHLRHLLDEEMGVPPMSETIALYEAIITDSLEIEPLKPPPESPALLPKPPIEVPSHPPLLIQTPHLPFTGRTAELLALRELAEHGPRKLALIEGEPGIGKTRLAAELLATSAAIPIFGTARELEQSIPYQPIIEALRSLLAHPEWPTLQARCAGTISSVWLAEVARLLPELLPEERVAAPAPDESRLWEGISQFLGTLANLHPLVVFLDDLHWADAATLALLGYLVRQPDAPILYLAAARPSSPRSPLATLLHSLTREDRLVRLALTRLTPDDIHAVALHLSPVAPEPLAAWLIRASEGNPYVLAELVRDAREQGTLASNGHLTPELPDSPVVPQTIYSLIQSRLMRLSDPARRVLDVAVVAGRDFDFEVVYRAAGLSEIAALDALDELRATALIVPGDGLRYSFDHALTMEVAWREVGEVRHRLLHRRVAEALEGLHGRHRDATAGLIAWHFTEGHAPERAAPYAVLAGQQAARLAAWKEAVAFYEQALAVDPHAEDVFAIWMALGDVRLHAGSAPQSTEAFQSALALARTRNDTAAMTAARLASAQSLISQARFGEVIAIVEQIASSAESALVRARAEMIWGTALSLEGADLKAAAEHLQYAETLARSDPATMAITWAQITFELGGVLAQQGDLQAAVDRYHSVLEIAHDAADRAAAVQWLILAHNNLGYHLLLLDDPRAADYAREGLRITRAEGLLTFQPYLLSTLGEIALASGDLDEAEQYFGEGLALAERLIVPERVAGMTANLGLVAQARGQTSLAIHRLSTALARADALGTRHLSAQIRIWLAPLLPPAEAHACLAEAHAIAENGGRQRLLDQIARLEADLHR